MTDLSFLLVVPITGKEASRQSTVLWIWKDPQKKN